MITSFRASEQADGVRRIGGALRRHPAFAVVAVGTLVIVLLTGLTVVVAYRRYNTELAEAARELRTLDMVLAGETARSFQSVDLLLDNVANQVAGADVRTPDALAEKASTQAEHDLLQARVTDLPQLDAVTIVGATGKLLNFSRSWPIPDIHLDDRDYFRALRDSVDTTFLSEPVINRGSGTPTIYLARRLSAPDGTFLGVVLGAISLASFEHAYASLELGPGNIVALWRTDGTLLARYPRVEVGKRLPADVVTSPGTPWHGIPGVFEANATVGGAPEQRIIASQAAAGFPIQVNVGRSRSLILEDWRQEIIGLGLAVGFAILCISGLMWALARRLKAQDAMARVERDRERAVAARERAEEARKAAEGANRAKSAFLANMSHELRTPLSAVIGYTEMLEEQAEDMGEAEMLTDLGKVKSNAKHLLGLINDVLDLSKVEANKMDLFAEDIDVAEFSRDAATTVDSLIQRKGNTLVLDLPEGLGTMHSDATKLRQCVFNLVGNAAKFTENGTITLRTRRETIEGVEWLSFAVEDTGIGMTQEQIGRLFERFAQADDTTTRKFGGTGLGLALSRAFARLLGGDITVRSAMGTSTTFTLRVPATAPEHPAAQVDEEDAPSVEVSETKADQDLVLVIDDDASQRDLMGRFLRRRGFTVRTASDGKSGLDLARSLIPRVVLLDVMMPGMDGWSVLKALKADAATSHIPVVMVSFVPEPGLVATMGAAESVPKPVDWDRLESVMERFRDETGDVLVVDDDPDMRHRLRTMLEQNGRRVQEASNGKEALERVLHAPPHIILLDLTMPVMDGFTFLHRLRDTPGCADIPVVVLSARDIDADDRRRLDAADAVLRKDKVGLHDIASEVQRIGIQYGSDHAAQAS